MKTMVRNGRVVLGDRIVQGGVLIEGERIVAAGDELPGGAVDRVFDAEGGFILPGLVDLHVHLDDRIGRFELADSYLSGSTVAARTGITTICSFITQGAEPLADSIDRALGKAARGSHCDLYWHLTPTRFEAADLAFLEGLPEHGWHTLKLYTTYREAGIYADDARVEDLFQRFGPLGFRFLVHCEDDAQVGAAAHPGLDLSRAASHALLRPPQAEAEAVRRIQRLAEAHGTAFHAVHVSTAEAALHLQAARDRGLPVSFETCPQYLWLEPSWLDREDGHRWICSPPLRGDREPFRDLARQGVFDVFATDHCPFCRRDKDAWDGRDLRAVPNGLPGLGGLLPLTWKLFEDDPERAARELARRAAENPARIAGLWPRKGALRPGADADLAVVHPDGPERPLRSSLADVWEPYPGFRTRLHVPLVLRRGEPVLVAGELVDGPPGGVALPGPIHV